MMSTRLKELHVTDPTEDQVLSTPEYKFMYEMYHGYWQHHLDKEDPMFGTLWALVNCTVNIETFFHQVQPIMEQVYLYEGVHYHALWTAFEQEGRDIVGPPDVITWKSKMAEPVKAQGELF